MIVTGKVLRVKNGEITLQTDETNDLGVKSGDICELRVHDGRSISPIQRKHIYALLRDIGSWSGYQVDEIKDIMKSEFCLETGTSEFSLSDTDMSTARQFAEWLIVFCITEDVPCKEPLINRTSDINSLLYHSVMNRKCAICGKKADIHEYDRVGIGRDREDIVHVGQRVQPLCRIHHSECHFIGQESFDSKYKLSWIKLNEDMCKAIGWSTKTS